MSGYAQWLLAVALGLAVIVTVFVLRARWALQKSAKRQVRLGRFVSRLQTEEAAISGREETRESDMIPKST